MTVAPSRRPPPGLPLALRNRLAGLILASLQDAGARRLLDELADSPEAVRRRWLSADARTDAGAVTARAGRAAAAVATRPLDREARGLAEPLGDAAALFDAGLYFEVHELLEPHWRAAAGAEREALQGLIQLAVGLHLANGNLAGARALLGESAAKLAGRRLAALDLTSLGEAAAATRESVGDDFDWTRVPRFPRLK